MIANDKNVVFARADDYVSRTMVGVRWSLDSAFTIHLTPYRESFHRYKAILICQHYVTVVNKYGMSVIEVRTMCLQMRITIQEKNVLKKVVINSMLYIRESKESLISVT